MPDITFNAKDEARLREYVEKKTEEWAEKTLSRIRKMSGDMAQRMFKEMDGEA